MPFPPISIVSAAPPAPSKYDGKFDAEENTDLGTEMAMTQLIRVCVYMRR